MQIIRYTDYTIEDDYRLSHQPQTPPADLAPIKYYSALPLMRGAVLLPHAHYDASSIVVICMYLCMTACPYYT